MVMYLHSVKALFSCLIFFCLLFVSLLFVCLFVCLFYSFLVNY